ncbi:MAG: hypothetical protein IJG60_07910 [Thermoguttaceae bacterium]|nr:hypothetical protein [Thermoguttaceae bacterium]
MKKRISNRSLRLESLEDRMLLAVTAGGEEAIAEYAAPAETGADVVIDVNFSALRSAINKASAGDTISFNGSGTITVTTPINLNKNITINGGGNVTLVGNGENFLFNITSSATLTGLGLEGGVATQNGYGGIGRVNSGVTLTLNDCTITGNTANDTGAGFMGGAFYVLGTLNVNDCAVYGNEAVYGGFAYLAGHDSKDTTPVVNASNTNFYGNTALSGGVIYNAGGTLNLTNCSVVGNSTTNGAGGAILNNNWFTVGGSEGNYTHEFYICDTTVTNSIIAYNYGTDQATADISEDFAKQLSGGGVLQWELFNIDDSFTKIKCVNSIIGLQNDYFVEAPVLNDDGSLANLDTLDLAIKTDSIAAYAGIGVNPGAYTGTGFSADSLVVTTLEDYSDFSDGEVSLREALAYATLGSFESAPTITFASDLAGGTITLENGQLAVISSLNIEADNVTVDADGQTRAFLVKSYNYQMNMEGNYHNFANVTVCPAHDAASGLINVSFDGLNITGGASKNNSRASGGGGILAYRNVNLSLANLDVSDNVFSINSDWAVEGATYTNIGGGGAAALLYANLALDKVNVVDNTVLVTDTNSRSTATIAAGGGVFIAKRSSLTATESAISGNSLTSENYLNNNANWGYGYGYGGGLCVFGVADVTYSEIAGNSIRGCAIYQQGGGAFHYISDYNRAAAGRDYSFVVTNTKITGNTIGNHYTENNGWCRGGGLFVSGKAILVNDLVAGNQIDGGNAAVNMTAYIDGAGIYNGVISDYNSQGQNLNLAQLDIYYTTITNNTVSGIDDATFSGTNGGGGIYNAYNSGRAATVNLVGSILYHNYQGNSTAGTTANNDSYNQDGSVFNMNNVLYNNSGTKGSGYNYESCTRWLSRYKVFTDEAGGDYTPWNGANPSQAFDALAADAPTPPAAYAYNTDIRGGSYVRVYGAAQDLGCYETQPEPAPAFDVTIVDYVGNYDGQAHTVSIEGLQTGDTVLYSEDGVNYSTAELAYTDPGAYTVYVKVERSGYQDFTGTGTVTINAVNEKLRVAVVVSASAASATEVDVLPDSITSATVGDTLYAQVWILNADNSALGCTGGYIDLNYTAAALDAGTYTVSPIYAQMATYVDYSADGLVATFGGCSQTGVNDLAVDQWALLGTFTFTASAAGDAEIASALPTMNGVHITGLNLARAGEGNFADSEIAFSSASFTITSGGGGEQLAAPTISTGANRIYVSYGANRHQLIWTEVANASGYELAYSADGDAWQTVSAAEASAVVRGLTYGASVTYRVRALGDGVSYTDSDWSATKTFYVCPMDINNDDDISGGDRTLLAQAWLTEEDEEGYLYYADINGDGDVGGADRAYLSNNWLLSVEDDAEDLQYPPARRADAFFADFASADLDVDLGAF